MCVLEEIPDKRYALSGMTFHYYRHPELDSGSSQARGKIPALKRIRYPPMAQPPSRSQSSRPAFARFRV
jgi:hypothetical protein